TKAKRPIGGATVVLDGATKGVMTNAEGVFRYANVVAGSHTVTTKAIGDTRHTQSVRVGGNDTVPVTLWVEPSASVLNQVVVTGTVAQTELKAVPNAMTVITAKQIEERGITKIDQLFRGDIPGLFAQNKGSGALLDEVTMFSRGVTALSTSS